MLDGHRVLVVVPARGGSKTIPNKNIAPVHGRPLLAYTADVVGALKWVDRAVVSTDSEAIAAAAVAHGLAAPFRRPAELSGDRIGDWDVLHHALVEMERQDGTEYDVVVMLQPTCPLRLPADVTATVTKLVSEGWDAVWTVTETDLKFHPLKALTLEADGRMVLFVERGREILARQQLSPVFHRNGAAYAVRRSTILDQRTILGARTAAVVITTELVNIDVPDDLRRAEALLVRAGRA